MRRASEFVVDVLWTLWWTLRATVAAAWELRWWIVLTVCVVLLAVAFDPLR